MNRQIKDYNTVYKAHSGRQKGQKRLRKIDQLFKHTPLLVSKGSPVQGADLIGSLVQIRRGGYGKKPRKNVWVIEDKAPAHVKAAKLCQDERERRGIMKVEWTPNSPDLHWIESLWDPLKDALQPR